MPTFLNRRGHCIVYTCQEPVKGPWLVFVPGFRSSCRASKKHARLRDVALHRGWGFASLDHASQGDSKASYSEVDVGLWIEDLQRLLSTLNGISSNPIILVGISLGAWISIKTSHTTALAGIFCIGGGINGTEKWLAEVPPDRRADRSFTYHRPSAYAESGYYEIPVSFLLDSKPYCIDLTKSVSLSCPIFFFHGCKDIDAPLGSIEELIEHMSSPLKTLDVVAGGDHRLSRPQDLDRMIQLLESFVENITSE
ncbi:hypothetical protein BZG36_03803 [Bifiguratus adelaidae]|uniref:Palmitoyl-protein thioesterase ABHD10, mitochondrial n=1 Tax=Bifiguratus adelaidae TaxID=1938954 RepID=A0A261XX36_9FUNG|nr:hypothetical protein BZG36_03803 [Bifiguratus adelaidae]